MKELMIAVERAVRPVRASAGRKDRMREELLAHLTAMYEGELARPGEADAARDRVLRRFGNPPELMRELQGSVSWPERVEFLLEQWLGWRAPETATQYTLRLCARLFSFSMVFVLISLAGMLLRGRPPDRIWTQLRVGGSFLVVLHIELFLLGLLYFKTRDALCGKAAAPRSWRSAFGLAAVGGLVTLASGPIFTLLAVGNLATGLEILCLWLPLAFLVPLGFVLFGVVYGPGQLRHAEWCCLDIGE
jgi:hypothetical protein